MKAPPAGTVAGSADMCRISHDNHNKKTLGDLSLPAVGKPGKFRRGASSPTTAGGREDRYGANAVPWLSTMALAACQNRPLFHACSTQRCSDYAGTILHRALCEFCQSETCSEDAEEVALEPWHSPIEAACHESQSALPELSATTHLLKRVREMYLSTYGDIGNQGCVVHLRLDDAPPKSHAYQCQIGDARLCKLLTWLHTTPGFGDRGIKLVTGPNDKDRCRHVCDQLEFPVEVEGNEDVDVDIWTPQNDFL